MFLSKDHLGWTRGSVNSARRPQPAPARRLCIWERSGNNLARVDAACPAAEKSGCAMSLGRGCTRPRYGCRYRACVPSQLGNQHEFGDRISRRLARQHVDRGIKRFRADIHEIDHGRVAISRFTQDQGRIGERRAQPAALWVEFTTRAEPPEALLQATVALPVLSIVMQVTVTMALDEENGVSTEPAAARIPGMVWVTLMEEYCVTMLATVLAVSSDLDRSRRNLLHDSRSRRDRRAAMKGQDHREFDGGDPAPVAKSSERRKAVRL